MLSIYNILKDLIFSQKKIDKSKLPSQGLFYKDDFFIFIKKSKEEDIKEYEKKIKTFLGLNLASNTLVCAISDRYFDLQNIDFEDWIVEKMRGFPA